MPADSPLSTVARVIELAVAPVFLLTALGTFLEVLCIRLARIVDRARLLGERLAAAKPPGAMELRDEAAVLARRRNLVNLAITFATCAALLVCVLIALAFIGAILRADLSRLVAGLFIAAMLAFIGALLAFLTEILLRVRSA